MEEEKATHFGIPVWKTPWTEEPGGLRSRGLQKFGGVACMQAGNWKKIQNRAKLQEAHLKREIFLGLLLKDKY